MILVEEKGRSGSLLVIRQTDHAFLAAFFARAWGNERFSKPQPNGSFCLAVAEHDNGWSDWELQPTVDPKTHLPYSFMSIPTETHVAIYHRGIPHIQIPTTLLAMVDSSIGGKTGVDTRSGKNLIGVFHHPSLVIDDIDLLKTLPRRQFNQGFAEIIKHAVIADAKMFRILESWDASSGLASEALALQSLIKRNIQIKSRIVAKDERDRTGQRALLNFGHTVGHAIERAGNYRKFLHGEAVSLGIVAACAISVKRAGLRPDQRAVIVDLLERFGLPTRLPSNFPRKKIFDAIRFDKKFEGGKVRFVVTPRIGTARITNDVTLNDIREAVKQL